VSPNKKGVTVSRNALIFHGDEATYRQINRQFTLSQSVLTYCYEKTKNRQRKRQMKASVGRMEPMLPEDRDHRLADLATDLVARSNALAGRLHPIMRDSIGDLVRSMNCYYSNLIEGHNTTPVDIEKALAKNYSKDQHKRSLQLEASAHIEVQRAIDRNEAPAPVVSTQFLTWVHREFCKRLPDELLWITNPDSGERVRVEPGVLRTGSVKVGAHVPPDAAALPAFLDRMEQAYSTEHLSKVQRIIAVAASHHRLLWVHPFFDGNGRVARLFSHAFLAELKVGSSLWSVSRGLARQVERYKERLMEADHERRGDTDGRGGLSLQGLEAFCEFFLETCVDQVDFMEKLLEPEELLRRVEIHVSEEVQGGRLPKGTWPLLREAIVLGEYSRGRAPKLTGYQERQARTVLNTLIADRLLVSPTTRSPVRLGLPIGVVDRWFPLLYPTVG
jgi:Fic family protein